MEKATLYDYARMCSSFDLCDDCPLYEMEDSKRLPCQDCIRKHTDKTNKLILDWCKKHPVETRQSRFLKIFPNAKKMADDIIDICPKKLDGDFICVYIDRIVCNICKKKYWLAEVDKENG